MTRDQFAVQVAVERATLMALDAARNRPGATSLQVEAGPVQSWDDIVETRTDDAWPTHLWQIKRQSTPFDEVEFKKLICALAAEDAYGHLAVRDLVSVRGVGELRVLRDVCDDLQKPGALPDLPEPNAAETQWIDTIAKWTGPHGETPEVLRRLRIELVYDEKEIARRAKDNLARLAFDTDVDVLWDLLHSFFSRHIDPIVAFTPDLIAQEVFVRLDASVIPPVQSDSEECGRLAAADVEPKLMSDLWPVRKQGYDELKRHTRCAHRSASSAIVLKKWLGTLGPLEMQDRAQCLRLWTYAQEWRYAGTLLETWLAAIGYSENAHGEMRSYFYEFLRVHPQDGLLFVVNRLKEVVASAPEHPVATKHIAVLIGWMSERFSMPDIPADAWPVVAELSALLVNDNRYDDPLRSVRRRLAGED